MWGLVVTPASVHNSRAACLAVALAKDSSARLVHVWADSAYRGFVEFARAILPVAVAIVTWKKKPKGV